jgi:phosphoglucosamine mutase
MSMFGTDGVRGPVGQGLLRVEECFRFAAVAAELWRAEGIGRVAIARDTRRSGGMLASALITGLTRGGIAVEDLGVLPTPALSWWIARSPEVGVGFMVTASHNPWADNGIKLFGADGAKLSDTAQERLEAAYERAAAGRIVPEAAALPGGLDDVGTKARFQWLDDIVPAGEPLRGRSIAADAAMGAAWSCLEEALARAGASVLSPTGVPDGMNINEGCGAVHPEALAAIVRETGAWAGVALDGDGDRVVLVDDRGAVHDGDAILGFLAGCWAKEGRLRGGSVAGTVATNGGLEAHLSALGLGLVRAAVGDRNVASEMGARGLNLGGESSGHILTPDLCPTGDGARVALLCLAAIAAAGTTPSSALGAVPRFHVAHRKVQVTARPDLASVTSLVSVVDAAEAELAVCGGRTLLRYSGTEPVLRIQVEGADAAMVESAADRIASTARTVLA